ncbi:MAG: hypothetical protein EOP51_14035 [Sphingobacteriales bacterium]|nr:MAG: hypothetical protein EOP51_14035 [Sphingobacteriales bacterium]
MKRIILTAVSLLALVIATYAQRNLTPELAARLRGKTNVEDIMNTVRNYYGIQRGDNTNAGSEFENNDYHWWQKWEYWAMRRLLPNKTLADYKALNYLAAQEVDARFASITQPAKTSIMSRNGWATEGMRTEAEITPDLSYGNWSFLGPANAGSVVNTQPPPTQYADILGVARMDRISFHPSNANIMYTGSPSGGVYKTTNGGSSWTAIGDGLPSGVSCIEVSKANGNIIYVFTGDGDSHRAGYLVFNEDLSPITGGMYKSVDGGTSWIKCGDLYTGAGALIGYNIAVAQNNSNYLYVATNQGVYRSLNGGSTWQQVRTGHHFDVEFRPNDDSTVYASTASAIAVSSGGGRLGTWTAATLTPAPTPTPVRIDLGVRYNSGGAVSTYVYALLSGSSVSGQFSGIYRSTNSGVSYSRQTNTPNILSSTNAGNDAGDLGDYGTAICVHPVDPDVIATAALNVWRSDGSNGGTTMVYSSTYREGNGPASAYIHPDIHDVQFNPLNNNLYAATDGGVYRSTDNGVSWTNISTGLGATQFYHMKMKDSDGDGEMNGLEILAGAQDNGLKYRNAAGTWVHFYCCDGFDGVIKGTDGDYVVANLNDSWKRSSNGGVTLTNLGSITFFTPFAIDYDNDDTMYAAASSLRRSYDGFQTFTTLSFDLNNFITTCPSNSARLYGSSSARTNLRISDDRGTSWTTISGNTGWPTGSPTVTDCKPWPNVSSEIYVSIGGYTAGAKVYRSLNSGSTWTNYSGSLPNVPVHSLCVALEGVYAGTEIGVFFRADGAADWTPFYTGMPKAIITDIWVNENGLVYASTFGRGIWIANRYSPCADNISVAGNLDGPHYYEAGISATVTATSESGAGTDIFVKSNNYIDLLEGFEMKDGTFFKAYLGPCGSGGIPNTNRGGRYAPSNDGQTFNLVEYNRRTQTAARKQQGAYFTLLADAVEINVPAGGTLKVEGLDTQTKAIKSILPATRVSEGMYKVFTGEGEYSIKVTLDGKSISEL